jgi:hypothetical protein|mmetsp:Transcript_96419/g.152498  ORF Transcript_96419/g.152498 Transcript_96419/m.152498 type:complete len:341 (+) Transcript_96419:82-1104(+)
MCQVVAKNTFISFDFEPELSPGSSRSRSADSIREHRLASTRLDFEIQSAKRLNAVLSIGLPHSASSAMEAGPVNLSDLRELQCRLSKALANPPADSLQKVQALKPIHNASCCSLSTMAPDDASDFSESRGLGMRHVVSSGSVSTMASDANDAFDWASCDEEGLLWRDGLYEAKTLSAFDGGSNSNSKGFECSHSLVPRNQNWADMQDNSTRDEPPTTMMIRNIPSRYSQQDLLLDLADMGFSGTFDFLYIPMDKSTSSNVGYAFVNFIDPYWANKCTQSFQNYRFKRYSYHGSKKVASVSVAHLQGLTKNLEHYEKSAVNSSKHVHRRPVVMASISKVLK